MTCAIYLCCLSHWLEGKIFEIHYGTHFKLLSMNPKNPENFLRAIGWPEAGAKNDLPLSKEERKKERKKEECYMTPF